MQRFVERTTTSAVLARIRIITDVFRRIHHEFCVKKFPYSLEKSKKKLASFFQRRRKTERLEKIYLFRLFLFYFFSTRLFEFALGPFVWISFPKRVTLRANHSHIIIIWCARLFIHISFIRYETTVNYSEPFFYNGEKKNVIFDIRRHVIVRIRVPMVILTCVLTAFCVIQSRNYSGCF